MKSCFMFGHRETNDRIYPQIVSAAERCIRDYGVNEFIVGHYGGFDRLAKRAILEIKRTCPVRLTLLLPYHPMSGEGFTGYDGTLYPFDGYVPPRTAIVRANRMVIDGSACVIAYVRHSGNAAGFLEYARKKGKAIILL